MCSVLDFQPPCLGSTPDRSWFFLFRRCLSTLVNAGSEEILSDLIEGPVSHRVAQSQGAKVEVISEGPLGSEVHHQTEGPQADPHQLHNPGDPKDYQLRLM